MSVKWERLNKLTPTTTALSEVAGTAAFGLGRSTSTPVISNVTAAMAKYGQAILYTDLLDLQAMNPRAMRMMEILGYSAGESLNRLMRDIWNGATTDRRGNGVTTTSAIKTAISLNDVKYCVNMLNRQSAMKFFAMTDGSRNIGTSPIRQSYYGIVHSDVEEDLRALTGWISAEQYAGQAALEPGEIGAMGGVRFITCPDAPVSSGAGKASANGLRGASATAHDVYSVFIYGKEAVGSVGLGMEHVKEIYETKTKLPTVELINHPPGSSGIADMFNEAGSLAWKAWFAGSILNNNWVAKLLVGASTLTT
jgi:N4-gp56 family major capsid protein